jgi:hypothetical protein
MKKNVGSVDRAIRTIIGAVLLIVGIFVQMGTGLRVVALTVAAIAFITAAAGF